LVRKFAGRFCLFFELFALRQDGIGAPVVDVSGVQIADAFVAMFVVIPVLEGFQRPRR